MRVSSVPSSGRGCEKFSCAFTAPPRGTQQSGARRRSRSQQGEPKHEAIPPDRKAHQWLCTEMYIKRQHPAHLALSDAERTHACRQMAQAASRSSAQAFERKDRRSHALPLTARHRRCDPPTPTDGRLSAQSHAAINSKTQQSSHLQALTTKHANPPQASHAAPHEATAPVVPGRARCRALAARPQCRRPPRVARAAGAGARRAPDRRRGRRW